jgi:hypothetical protein
MSKKPVVVRDEDVWKSAHLRRYRQVSERRHDMMDSSLLLLPLSSTVWHWCNAAITSEVAQAVKDIRRERKEAIDLAIQGQKSAEGKLTATTEAHDKEVARLREELVPEKRKGSPRHTPDSDSIILRAVSVGSRTRSTVSLEDGDIAE